MAENLGELAAAITGTGKAVAKARNKIKKWFRDKRPKSDKK